MGSHPVCNASKKQIKSERSRKFIRLNVTAEWKQLGTKFDTERCEKTRSSCWSGTNAAFFHSEMLNYRVVRPSAELWLKPNTTSVLLWKPAPRTSRRMMHPKRLKEAKSYKHPSPFTPVQFSWTGPNSGPSA